MSYALRHHPEEYGLKLAADGSAELDAFLKAVSKKHHLQPELTEADVREIMANADKQRFAIEDGRIRALYGHSFPTQIRHEEADPPDILYHGTAHKFLDAIMKKGLLPMGRQFVHLSADTETAEQVGQRRDRRPAILIVNAKRAKEAGIQFYIGNDKVWLADRIPPEYLSLMIGGADHPTAITLRHTSS